jgi:copper transport protein
VLADPAHPRWADGVRRVSTLALGAVLVVAATGVAQLWLFLPDAKALVHEPYGMLSVVKIAGLLVLVAFGAYHRYALVPRLSLAAALARLRRTVGLESSVMLLVILVGGLLAYVPP